MENELRGGAEDFDSGWAEGRVGAGGTGAFSVERGEQW